ncbi:hypothetical protein Bbelb_377580, partial [Branchiostoma belcheri]
MSGRQQWRSQTGDINEAINMQDVANIATTPNTIYVPGSDVMNMQESQTDWTDVATTPNSIYVPGADVRSGDDVIKRICCKRSKKLWKTIGIAFAFGVAIVLKGLQAMEKSYPWELIIRLDCLDLLSLLKLRVLWEWMVRLGYLGLLGLQKKRVLWEWMVRLGYLGLLDLLKERVLWKWMVRLGYLGLLGLLKERVLWEWMIIMKSAWWRKTDGYPGITPVECHDRGCCFNNVPYKSTWCYFKQEGCQYAGEASCMYRGTVSVTNTGKTCQRWGSQIPHEHIKTPAAYPSAGLEQNYCRNPDGELGVWCFTTDPNSRWELCDVPSCVSCQYADGASYRGTVSVTKTGKTCQRWDSQTPHGHYNTPAAHPSAGLEQNYCRNPDGDRGVWCYTTDPNSRWELCD